VSSAAQGRILTTDTFPPLHRRSPASHSLIVCDTAAASSPTVTHTFNPGVKQSAESLQRHMLVWSEKMVGRQMGWITTVRTHTLRLILCNYQTPLPSHISHMWHMVQPVVLRSGHLHVLSSAIIWLFPIQCRACILQTLRRTVLLFTGLVAHTSKDELLTQSSTGTREFMKYVQFLHVSWTKWWNIPALERHFANTFSSGGFLPRLTLHDRRAAWLWCADCGIHQRIVIPRCIHACNENFVC